MNRNQFTPNIQKMIDEKTQSLESLVCREDVEFDIKSLDRIPERNKSSKALKRKELIGKYKSLGIENADTLLSKPENIAALPTRNEIMQNLADTFYEIYKELPTPEKILRRQLEICAPECLHEKESTALALVRFFLEKVGLGCAAFPMDDVEKAVKKSLEKKKSGYHSMNLQQKQDFLQKNLTETVFDDLKALLEEQKNLPAKKLALLLAQFDLVEDSSQAEPALSEETIDALRMAGAKGNTHRQLLKNAESLPPETLEPLFENFIFKDKLLKKQMASLCFVTKKNGAKKTLREGYDQARRDLKKKLDEVSKMPALSCCWNLANGRMKNFGECKERLYLFAIAAGLQWCDPNDGIPSVQKFLADYGNSLLKIVHADQVPDFMPDEKNYWEAIYLYCLRSDKAPCTVAGKLDFAKQCICACASEGNTKKYSSENDSRETSFFAPYVKELCKLDTKEQVCAFIRANFQIPAKNGMPYTSHILIRHTGNETLFIAQSNAENEIGENFFYKVMEREDSPLDLTDSPDSLRLDWRELCRDFCGRYSGKDDASFLRYVKRITQVLTAPPVISVDYEQRNLLLDILSLLALKSPDVPLQDLKSSLREIGLPMNKENFEESFKGSGASLNHLKAFAEYLSCKKSSYSIDSLAKVLQKAGFPLQKEGDAWFLREKDFAPDSPAETLWKEIKEKALPHFKAIILAAKEKQDAQNGMWAEPYDAQGNWPESSSERPLFELYELNSDILSILPKTQVLHMTRAQVMAAVIDYYLINILPQKEPAQNLSCLETYREFREFANKQLAKSRFSPIDEKSALDCYCRLALYRHLVKLA